MVSLLTERHCYLRFNPAIAIELANYVLSGGIFESLHNQPLPKGMIARRIERKVKTIKITVAHKERRYIETIVAIGANLVLSDFSGNLAALEPTP